MYRITNKETGLILQPKSEPLKGLIEQLEYLLTSNLILPVLNIPLEQILRKIKLPRFHLPIIDPNPRLNKMYPNLIRLIILDGEPVISQGLNLVHEFEQ